MILQKSQQTTKSMKLRVNLKQPFLFVMTKAPLEPTEPENREGSGRFGACTLYCKTLSFGQADAVIYSTNHIDSFFLGV